MTRTDSGHLDHAKRLLAHESASGGGDTVEPAAAAGRVYETLFRSLAPVIGAAGFRALFARSLKLTKAELPSLLGQAATAAAPLESNPEVVHHLAASLSELEPAAASEVVTALYANLLGLMTNLIGEALVRQLVKRAYPTFDETGTKETS